MTPPRPIASIAAGLAWRAVAAVLILLGLWTALAAAGDWIAATYPNPPPCADCYGDWND